MFVFGAGGTSPPLDGGAGGVLATASALADATMSRRAAVTERRSRLRLRLDTPPAPPSKGGDDARRNQREDEPHTKPTFRQPTRPVPSPAAAIALAAALGNHVRLDAKTVPSLYRRSGRLALKRR